MKKAFDVADIDRNYIDELSNKFRSPHLWKYSKKEKKWKLNYNL